MPPILAPLPPALWLRTAYCVLKISSFVVLAGAIKRATIHKADVERHVDVDVEVDVVLTVLRFVAFLLLST